MRAPGPSSRHRVGALGLALVVAGLGGCSRGPTPGDAASRLVGGLDASDVESRPWPERVAPTGVWSASVAGGGPRVTLSISGTISGDRGRTTVNLGTANADGPTSGRALVLPDGTRWFPQKPFEVEGGGIPFVGAAFREPILGQILGSGTEYAFAAAGREIAVGVDLGALADAAGGSLVAHGEFVGEDGTKATTLSVPAGTRVASAGQEAAGDGAQVVVTVEASSGTTVTASGNGEAAVAGKAVAEAEGRSWEGLVTAVEGEQVTASATFDGTQWKLTADVQGARQVWVDGWPVADTVLDARSYSVEPGFFDRNQLLKVEWINVGYATAQILEAEGSGPGALRIGFDLNKSLGHDAGLAVRRGDRVTNLRGGADIDSNLAPGEKTNRELSYDQGQAAILVLRGNFPDVRIELAVPGT